MGKLESKRDVFFSQYLVEFALAVASVSFNGFVHHIPAFDAAFIPPHDGVDVIPHPLFQDFG